MTDSMRSMTVAALIRDGAGATLIAKPTYREGWLLPVGMVEEVESSKRAYRHKIKEEIALALEVGRLLCDDYQRHSPRSKQSLKFIFAGSSLDERHKTGIVLQEDKIADHAFVSADEALEKLHSFLSCRLWHTPEAEQTGQAFYLED